MYFEFKFILFNFIIIHRSVQFSKHSYQNLNLNLNILFLSLYLNYYHRIVFYFNWSNCRWKRYRDIKILSIIYNLYLIWFIFVTLSLLLYFTLLYFIFNLISFFFLIFVVFYTLLFKIKNYSLIFFLIFS